MFSVDRQQHSFPTHERMLLWKCWSFWDRKCLNLMGTLTPNLRIHAECSNHLSYHCQLHIYSMERVQNWPFLIALIWNIQHLGSMCYLKIVQKRHSCISRQVVGCLLWVFGYWLVHNRQHCTSKTDIGLIQLSYIIIAGKSLHRQFTVSSKLIYIQCIPITVAWLEDYIFM